MLAAAAAGTLTGPAAAAAPVITAPVIAAPAAADPLTPVWDAGTARWWLWQTTGQAVPRPVAWWDGTTWVPTSTPTTSGTARAVERRGQTVTVAGRTLTYDLLGAPDHLAGLVVYLDGDGMHALDDLSASPLGGAGGLVDVAARHGYQVIAPRAPSSDLTWWRDLDANAAAIDELTRRITTEAGAQRVALVGYSGGAQLAANALLGRGLCTSVAVLAGGGGTHTPPAPPAATCPVLWATGTADTGAGSSDGYDALADARAGSAAYLRAGWPATIWTPVGVDHDAIRGQLGALLDYQLTEAAGRTAPTPSPTATTTGPTAEPRSTSTSSTTKSFTGQTLSGTLTTPYWPGQIVQWLIATPQGTPKGTVIVLHGRSDSARKAFDGLGLAGLARSTGYALAAIDGESTYWTNFGGVDTASMVVDDFLPVLASTGLPVDRVALTGYSMGGLGALLIAEQLGAQRVSAVMPMSGRVGGRAPRRRRASPSPGPRRRRQARRHPRPHRLRHRRRPHTAQPEPRQAHPRRRHRVDTRRTRLRLLGTRPRRAARLARPVEPLRRTRPTGRDRPALTRPPAGGSGAAAVSGRRYARGPRADGSGRREGRAHARASAPQGVTGGPWPRCRNRPGLTARSHLLAGSTSGSSPTRRRSVPTGRDGVMRRRRSVQGESKHPGQSLP